MTRTRKDGSQYRKKFRRLVLAFAPHVDLDTLEALVTRLDNARAFAQALACADRAADGEYYPSPTDMPVANRPWRCFYCDRHQVVHTYTRRQAVEAMSTERDATVAEIAALNPHASMPHDLKEMVISRFNSTLDTMFKQHEDTWSLVNKAYRHKQRVVLSNFFEALPHELKVDFYLCGRKNTYQSWADAEVALISLPPNAKGPEEYIVYACRYCGHHHVGRADKNNNYDGASPENMEAYASFTWYNHYKKAKKYAIGRGLDMDTKVTHQDVIRMRDNPPTIPIFLNS